MKRLTIAGVLLAVIGLIVWFVAPRWYVSTAVIRAQETSPSPNLQEYVMQLQREILSRTSLKSIIEDPRLDLYPAERLHTPLEDVIEKMRRRDIRITQLASTDGHYLSFEIAFAYPDPRKAQQVVRTLVTKFMEENIIRQRNTASEPQAATDQIGQLEARVAVLEKRLNVATPEPPIAITLETIDPPSLPERPTIWTR